jgi:4-hydroxybenzoate polyprenyltransferase
MIARYVLPISSDQTFTRNCSGATTKRRPIYSMANEQPHPVHNTLRSPDAQPTSAPCEIPLVVDFDGTLSRTDTLEEATLRVLLRDPLALLSSLLVLATRGRLAFKLSICSHPAAKAIRLPINSSVLTLARTWPGPVVLCTASLQDFVLQCAFDRTPFSQIIGSTPSTNLKGTTKADFLVKRFGRRSFAYVGNDHADLPVWREAARGFAVNCSSKLLRVAREQTDVQVLPIPQSAPVPAVFRMLRPHQWSKNLLIFVPLITSHTLSLTIWVQAIAYFACFCVIASGTYLINDLFDLDADRAHQSKCKRPLAAGEIRPLQGFILAAALTIGGLFTAWTISPAAGAITLLYCIMTLAYTCILKTQPLVDVFTLALLYTLRIVAGGLVCRIAISPYLLGFSTLLFLSLALCKRYTELVRGSQAEIPAGGPARRDYKASDSNFIFMLGIGFLVGAVTMLCNYLNIVESTGLYKNTWWIWAVVVVFTLWISRVWLLAHRRILDEDPVLFAVKDQFTWGVVVTALIFGYLAHG